jgi:hypothetical protein
VEEEAATTRAYGEASGMKVVEEGSHKVYRGPEVLYLALTLWMARSFTDK